MDNEMADSVDAWLLPGATEPILVKAGSEARRNTRKQNGTPHVDRSVALRDELIRTGILVPLVRDSNILVFTRDYEFETPGRAAEIILGRNKSARTLWREVASGKSLYELNPTKR